MDLSNKLTNKLFKSIIEQGSIKENASFVLSEGVTLKDFYNTIKKMLALDVNQLIELSENGGTVSEDVIEINSLLIETDEDFSHIDQSDEADPLDLGPVYEHPTLTVQTAVSGNFSKIIKVNIKTSKMSWIGYVPVVKNISNDSIYREIKNNLINKEKITVSWYNNIKKAMSVMSDLEAREKENLINKHLQQRKLVNAQKPIPPTQTQKIPISQEIAAKIVGKKDKTMAEKISKMTKENFIKVVEIGKKNLNFSKPWELFKGIFLTYLSVTALVSGVPGIAALVVGYMATKGIDHIASKSK